jgi:ubiquinone/menaquinone biosynthesis C-methylase UbiE
MVARFDGLADWYDREFATSPLAEVPREIVLRLVGEGPGTLLDVGCGTGFYSVALAERGWAVTGVDISEDMLRLAHARGVDAVHADAAALPFDNESFDAVVSICTHTDVDDFAAAVREVARVLRPNHPFVYLGVHPCFVGPHSRFVSAEGVPVLHPGYRRTGRYTDAPGISPDGLRAKVGATHLSLGVFLQTFLDAGFRLERFEEAETREYPYLVAVRCRA